MAASMNRVLRSQLKNATHWSVRSITQNRGISKSTVARCSTLFGLQPDRSKRFKLSQDSSTFIT